jgi:hypothetical protein
VSRRTYHYQTPSTDVRGGQDVFVGRLRWTCSPVPSSFSDQNHTAFVGHSELRNASQWLVEICISYAVLKYGQYLVKVVHTSVSDNLDIFSTYRSMFIVYQTSLRLAQIGACVFYFDLDKEYDREVGSWVENDIGSSIFLNHAYMNRRSNQWQISGKSVVNQW